jgi:uncharacterized protein
MVRFFLKDLTPHGEGAVGMSMTPREGEKSIVHAGSIAGRSLKEIAAYVKSWNNYEAALGLAAINSFVNAPKKIELLNGAPIDQQPQINVFELMTDRIKGKKVAVIGHFRGLEKMTDICHLSILERFPQPGDYPDPACEYILPEQDYVFITGTTLINKTLPRLLQLSRNAFVSIVGPSTPLCPVFFKYGVDLLAGTVITDGNRVKQLIREGDQHDFFDNGASMVRVCNSV